MTEEDNKQGARKKSHLNHDPGFKKHMHTTYAAAKTHKASSFSTLKKIFVVAVLLLTTNVFSLHSKVVSSFFGDKQAIDYGNIHDSVRTNNNTIQVPSGATINSTAADMVPSIIAVLRGEMGNHLSGLAQAKGLQLMLKKEYNLDSKVLLHHRGDPQGLKWRNVKKVFQSCFPKLEKWNLQELEEDNTFRPTIRLQKDWLNNSNYKIALDQVNGQPLPLYQHITADSMQKALGTFAALWQDPSRPQPPGNKISIPFLMTTTLASNFLTDRYYDEIRELFSFNQSCCKLLPDPDETVFHFRNFDKELAIRGKQLGYSELSPNKTAHLLLGHLPPGSKVAITTRFHNAKVQEYVDSFVARNWRVRVVTGQTGMEDFCFLANAQKEMVGSVVSTFARWAALLGSAKRAQLYIHDTIGLRKMIDHLDLFTVLGMHWTNPKLKGRILFPIFQSEYMEREGLQKLKQEQQKNS